MSLSKVLSAIVCTLGDGRSDMRCVFGTRFDIGEASSRASGFQE